MILGIPKWCDFGLNKVETVLYHKDFRRRTKPMQLFQMFLVYGVRAYQRMWGKGRAAEPMLARCCASRVPLLWLSRPWACVIAGVMTVISMIATGLLSILTSHLIAGAHILCHLQESGLASLYGLFCGGRGLCDVPIVCFSLWDMT